MRRIVPVSLLCLAMVAHAAPPPTAQREIAQLFAALDRSGCRFERNGSVFDAKKAHAHLQDKYDYLLKRDAVDSAERFIDLAASKSSMTGRPYHVQCPGHAPVESGAWFRGVLARLRAAHGVDAPR